MLTRSPAETLPAAPTLFQRRVFKWKTEAQLCARNANRCSLKRLFGRTSDLYWYWVLTEGRRTLPRLAAHLPTLPPEDVQAQYTGLTGDAAIRQAFLAVLLFRKAATSHGLALGSPALRMLDFGCGWGRITQVFLRDFEPDQIIGADVDQEILDVCHRSGLGCRLLRLEPMPPMDLPNESVDLITAYSVFSHLSEEVHWAWLEEFDRVLRPGGVVTATTRPREFIDHVVALRARSQIPDFARGAAQCFLDSQAAFAQYDSGGFCFDARGGGGGIRTQFYGEACIPRHYVETRWSKLFSHTSFIDHLEHRCFDQNLLIARKQGNTSYSPM